MVQKRRRPSSNRPPPANDLLTALPVEDFARLAPTFRNTPLKLKRFLYKPGETVDQVYFPGGGFVSVVTVLKDGGMVEVATIGREGMLGMSGALNGDPSPSASMVQAETDVCYTMSANAFRQEMDRRAAFYDLLTRYGQALVGFIMQSTACNAVHSVEQRLSRWLLLAHDRVGTDEFPLTQEFAAMMLGTSRPTVTVVAGTLQKAAARRGTLLEADRRGDPRCVAYKIRANSHLVAACSALRAASPAATLAWDFGSEIDTQPSHDAIGLRLNRKRHGRRYSVATQSARQPTTTAMEAASCRPLSTVSSNSSERGPGTRSSGMS